MRISMTSAQCQTIANMASVAAEQYKSDADLLMQIAANGGPGSMGKEHALKVADHFKEQEREARVWSERFINADSVEVLIPDVEDTAVAS